MVFFVFCLDGFFCFVLFFAVAELTISINLLIAINKLRISLICTY